MFPARPLRSVCVSVADMLAATGKDEGFGRPRPTARASSTSPVRRRSPRRRRGRRWRRGRDHLVLVGAPQRYRPRRHGCRHRRSAGCLSQRRADRSSADYADGVAAFAGRWSRLGGPRPAGRWVVESDRRLGSNGALQPPAPRLVSGKRTCSVTLGRACRRAAGGGAHVVGGRQRVRRGRGPGGGVVPPVRGVAPRRCKATSGRPGTPRGRTPKAGCCARRRRAARGGTGAVRRGRRIVLGAPRDEKLVGVDDD
jgi:hypothetical protein